MCKIVTEKGMEEIGDPKEMPLYGYSTALEEEHDPHWDSSEFCNVDVKSSLMLIVKGLPIRVSGEEAAVIIKGRRSRGENF